MHRHCTVLKRQFWKTKKFSFKMIGCVVLGSSFKQPANIAVRRLVAVTCRENHSRLTSSSLTIIKVTITKILSCLKNAELAENPASIFAFVTVVFKN